MRATLACDNIWGGRQLNQKGDIELACRLLKAGELVAFPTETVYGLGADASSEQAISRIYALKGRPSDHPVIVHLANASDMIHWARDIPPSAWALANAFWPGPLTLILPRGSRVPLAVTGGQDSTATVTLELPAAPGSVTVWLSTSDAAVAYPDATSLVIPAGATSVLIASTGSAPVTVVVPEVRNDEPHVYDYTNGHWGDGGVV